MAKLYYGNGECSIDGDNIAGVQISYTGTIQIEDQSPEGYELMEGNNQILIFPLNSNASLNNLFNYVGTFNIDNIIVSDNNLQRVTCQIKRVMDYSQLLNTNAEDLTTNSEDLNSGYKVTSLNKRFINTPTINNLNTAEQQGSLYLENRSEYHGYFHIHKKTGNSMTGSTHSTDSQTLYIIPQVGLLKNKLISTKYTDTKKIREQRGGSGTKGKIVGSTSRGRGRASNRGRSGGGGGY
jgi:hypothetical protein